MNAGNVTKLHTLSEHRTNRNDLMHFDCITACKINPFENQMTLARSPTVLSTHTNDHAVSRYCEIAEAKTARKKL